MFIRANILIMNKITRSFMSMEKLITQDLKTLWTNISISFTWDHFQSKIIFSSCATDVIHSKTVFHSLIGYSFKDGISLIDWLFIQRRYFTPAPERLIFLFSFIITNCFNNCYTAFPWLPVSNILDFKFYCNRILFYFENDLRWKRSKY